VSFFIICFFVAVQCSCRAPPPTHERIGEASSLSYRIPGQESERCHRIVVAGRAAQSSLSLSLSLSLSNRDYLRLYTAYLVLTIRSSDARSGDSWTQFSSLQSILLQIRSILDSGFWIALNPGWCLEES
jgi:hypothetical protein